jgi:hypothetical protein
MSLLKQILNSKLSEDETSPLVAATPQNKAQTSFSLLQNIHGSDLSSSDVTNHLTAVDDAEEAVDTVAFGLETTDGDIVKVYVNAEEAEAFEQKMAQLLGKIDDIDQAIEELSNEFDIVSVVKPGEMDAPEVELGGENPEGEAEVGIENRLDEPLSDDDIVQDLDGEDLIDDESEKKKKDEKDDKKDDESEDEADSEKEDDETEDEKGSEEDGLSFGDDEEKPEGDESEEEADSEKEDGESEDETDVDPEDDPEGKDKDKKKDKKKSKNKEDKMKQEGQSLLQYLVSLNEAKEHKKEPKKVEVKKEEPKKTDSQPDDSADVFNLSLTKEEEELSKLFATPVQQLIFRTILLLGVNADQINIRKFKVRKSVKDVATMIQHHPQIKNVLSKLGKDLASKKGDIHKLAEAVEKEEKVQGTIKDQLSTEISKKIYNLILALGIPEFLLTYKKTAFRGRIKNLATIAIKHSRIKTYIYMLSDLLKAEHKNTLKEGYETAKAEINAKEEMKAEPEFKSSGLLEDFSKTDNAADLGTFTVVSMGTVGGTTLKVKDFSVEFDEEQFEKLVAILGDGKSGVVKSENLGKVNLIALARGKEYVIKSVKPSQHDKYPFGVVISAKSIDKILG